MSSYKHSRVGDPQESGKIKIPAAKIIKCDISSLIRRANAEYNRLCDENGDI